MKFLLCLALTALSFSAQACKLDGKWKSHKSRSLSELYGSKLSDDRKIKMSRLFGQMVVEYKNCQVAVVDFEGIKTEYRFQIVEESSSFVVIKDLSTGDLSRMDFYEKCYSTPVKGLGFNEHFCKE